MLQFIKKIFDKILYFIKKLIKIKIILSRPTEKKILIFDKEGSSTKYYKLFKKKKCGVLDVRGESVNIFVILRLLIRFKFSLNDYIKEYISLSKPKFIFHNSYNKRFFLLDKKDYKFDFIKIFTQSELKNKLEYKSIFFGIKKKKVDYLFTWNHGMKKMINKYIEGKFIISGIFFNNIGPKIKKKYLKKKISFVSQYRPPKRNINQIENYSFNRRFSWQQFHQPEIDIAIYLKKYCNKKRIPFEIVGSSVNNFKDERVYYEKFLGKKKWNFVKPTTKKRGLVLTLKSKFVVTIDSTLGYECLFRGQRVGFFTIRDRYINSDYLKFGWPNNYPSEGPCWTCKGDKKSFNRIMNFLINGSDQKWKLVREKSLKNLVTYDFGNTKYLAFLKKMKII